MSSSSDLIDHFKLDVDFGHGYVSQTSYTSDHARGLRKTRVEKRWYRLNVIGEGACGTVWLEVDQKGKEVGEQRAVKEIRKSRMRMFQIDIERELLAMAKLSKYQDQGLFVHLFGWFDNEEAIFLAMEYFPHSDLGKYITAGFREADAKIITRQLLEGLEVLHANNFAHRDLKPQNIFVVSKAPHWWVKIGDFGISKRAENEVTSFRTEVGTRPYQAPEILGIIQEDEQSFNYTKAVDMWSLGCVCFQLLTGSLPSPNRIALETFCNGRGPFPTAALSTRKVNAEGIGLITDLMAPLPSKRLTAYTALHAPWLQQGTEPLYAKEKEDEIMISCRVEGSKCLDVVEQVLVEEPDTKADGHDGQTVPCVLADIAHKTVVKLPLREKSDLAADERNPNQLTEHEALVENHGEKGKMKDRKGVASNGESNANTAIVDTSKIVRRDSILEGGDYFTAIPQLRSDILQPPDMNRYNSEAEQKIEVLNESQRIESNTARNGKGARLLLKKGFDIKQKDLDKKSAFIWAAKRGHLAAIQILLEMGACIEAEIDNWTALQLAAFEGHETVVRLLLEKGANINAKLSDGSTALHHAAQEGHEATVRVLLKKGAKIDAKTSDGLTALSYAVQEKHETVGKLLKEARTKSGGVAGVRSKWQKLISK